MKRLRKHDEKEQEKPKTKDGKEKNYIPVTDYKPIEREVRNNG